jgi:predicted dehydrogenase
MSKQSRREFLENSMLATVAAMGASAAVSPQAQAAPGSKSPNERLRIAVLGVHGRGRSHIGGFGRRNDCQIAAVVDPDEAVGGKRAEETSKKYGYKVDFYQDLRKVMDDDSIDIVTIATPNHWHSLAGIWAIQSGKDVYVEKPVSHNVNEGRRLVQAARKYNKMCQAGTQCRSMQGTKDAIAHVHNGGIGEVKLARGLCYKRRKSIGPKGNYDVPASVDYNLWAGPAPASTLTRQRFHYDWHWQWNWGNGDMGNQGIHQMDLARWGLQINDLGESVLCYGGRLGYTDAGQTANTQINIHKSGDKTLVFETRGLETGSYKGAKIGVIYYGSEGFVALTSYKGGGAFDLDGKLVKKFSGGPDNAHWDNFIDVVRSRKNEDLNGEILKGHISSAFCHLGNISYRLGQKITAREAERRLSGDDEAVETFQRTAQHLSDNGIDLEKTPIQFGPTLKLDGKKEVFVGDGASQANAMLTRDYRKDFEVPDSEAKL